MKLTLEEKEQRAQARKLEKEKEKMAKLAALCRQRGLTKEQVLAYQQVTKEAETK